jgi:uncharacterized membrane protein
MNRHTLGLISAILVVAMGGIALAAGLRLPLDLALPVHWDLSGEPDSFAGKWVGLLMPAAITAGVSLLFWALPLIEPRSRNLSRSQGLYLWGWAALLVMSIAVEIVVLSVAFHWNIPTSRMFVGALGIIFVMIGNQLGKSRSMFLIGLRTPWTLASEEVWVRTHSHPGKLMVLGGLVAILAALLPLPSGLLVTIVIATIAAAAIIPIVYSFLLWRREPKRAPADPAQE